MTRILGVDLGSDRTGLAVGSFGVAHPLTVVESRDDDEIVERVVRYALEENVREIVVGLAVLMDGSEGPAAVRQRWFAGRIADAAGLEVHLWDERLTTAEAERALIGAGVRRKQRRDVVDKIAATLILQSYLDAHREKA